MIIATQISHLFKKHATSPNLSEQSPLGGDQRMHGGLRFHDGVVGFLLYNH